MCADVVGANRRPALLSTVTSGIPQAPEEPTCQEGTMSQCPKKSLSQTQPQGGVGRARGQKTRQGADSAPETGKSATQLGV